jgi:glycerophosphoryl diester phosphodiesterase
MVEEKPGPSVNLSSYLNRIRGYWRPILLVHLLFTLAGLIVLMPLFGALLQGLLSLSGSSAVADQDIARLILSPLGMMAAILLVALFLALAGLEMGALQAVSLAARHNQPFTALQAGSFAFRHALLLLRLTLGLTLRVLAYLAPYVLCVGAVALLLLAEHDINYYLDQRPAEFGYALVFAGIASGVLLFLLGRRLLGWCLVLPLVLFGDSTPEKSFRESEERVAGRRGSCLKSLLAWLAVVFLLGAIPAAFLATATAILVDSGIEKLAVLVGLLGLVALIWNLLNFFAAALALALLIFLLDDLYHRFGAPPSAAETQAKLHRGGRTPGANRTPASVTVTLLIVACVAAVSGALLLRDIQLDDHTTVVAHRGAAGAAPENTLAAVHRAVADGTDWVEIDVQETRDGQVIVVHDSDFMKLAGNPLKVWDGDLAEIQQIDIGSWFHPSFADQRVPTLRDVLEAVRGQARLVIELKYYGHDQALEQRVIDIVEQAGMQDEVAVMSLKLAGVEKVRSLRPDWPIGLLAATAVGDLARLDVDFLAVSERLANPGLVRRAHAAGKKVFVWTVNDGLSLSRWMSTGVDGVITDEPGLARNIISQRGRLSTVERLLLSSALIFGQPDAVKKYRDNSP